MIISFVWAEISMGRNQWQPFGYMSILIWMITLFDFVMSVALQSMLLLQLVTGKNVTSMLQDVGHWGRIILHRLLLNQLRSVLFEIRTTRLIRMVRTAIIEYGPSV